MRPAQLAARVFCLAAVVAVAWNAGCTRQPRWRALDSVKPGEAELALTAASVADLSRRRTAAEIAPAPIRQRLRPCCAFGVDLRAKLGRVPVPAFRIGNIRGRDEVGPHTFDSGVLHVRQSLQQKPLVNNENNGLVYTCRGGFIDIAHVRDYADWGFYLGTRIGRGMEEGASIPLPNEGGTRRIVLRPVPPEIRERYDWFVVATTLAEWITLQMSIWHEIATWYGWSALPGFPERASAFSPEDVYSNLVGIKIAAVTAYRRGARSEYSYNAAITRWLDQALIWLGDAPRPAGREAMQALDGLWWDSGKRLPDARVVIRRTFDFDSPLEPWLVPPSRMPASLQERCGTDPEPFPIPFRSERDGLRFGDFVSLEIRVDDRLAAQAPFPTLGRSVTQDDFPAILAAIREQNRQEFGEGSDRPEPPEALQGAKAVRRRAPYLN